MRSPPHPRYPASRCPERTREDPRGPERTRPACAHQHPPLPPPCSRSPFIPPPPALASPSGPAHLRRPARAPGPPEPRARQKPGPPEAGPGSCALAATVTRLNVPPPPPLPEHQGRAVLARPSEHPFPYTAPPAARPLPATPAGPARALARDNPSSPHPHSLRPVLPTSQQADKPTSRQVGERTNHQLLLFLPALRPALATLPRPSTNTWPGPSPGLRLIWPAPPAYPG